ncbi:MAG: hypothetical protein WCS73_03730 [Lentisphaeria bacterium]
MFLTAYCLSYGCWTVIPKQWQESFEDIKANGFDAVALSFSESEMRYSRRTFEMQVNIAHRCGLKVLAIPSRIGGRFAGSPLMPSLWTCENSDVSVPGVTGLGCIESPKFCKWAGDFITTLCTDYEIDGLIWDEPKNVDLISTHPETIKKFGPNPTKENMQDSYVDFLQALIYRAKAVRPELQMTMFNMPNAPEYFTRLAAFIEGLDFIGYDGNFQRQSFFKEKPKKIKESLSSVWERTKQEACLGNKKTFALIENMLMPQSVHAEYEEGLTKYLESARPDHLSCYYYAHNNEAPEEVHNITMRVLKQQLSRSVTEKQQNSNNREKEKRVCV